MVPVTDLEAAFLEAYAALLDAEEQMRIGQDADGEVLRHFEREFEKASRALAEDLRASSVDKSPF